MPKRSINRTEINKVQKFLRAGETPEDIARAFNIELGVVQAFDPENEKRVRKAIADAENVMHLEDKILKDEEDAAKRKRRDAALKAAATRKRNAEAKADAG